MCSLEKYSRLGVEKWVRIGPHPLIGVCFSATSIYAKASIGGQLHTRLRSPNAASILRTGGQYLVRC